VNTKNLLYGFFGLGVILMILMTGLILVLYTQPTPVNEKPVQVQFVQIENQVITAVKSTPKLSNYKTYESPEYGIKIIYPLNWTKMEQISGTVVAFLSPAENPSDIFQENIIIFIEDITDESILLDEYTRQSIADLKQRFTDSQIVESTKTILSGYPADKIVFTGVYKKHRMQWMTTYTTINKKLYIITYTAEDSKFYSYEKIADKMIDSFKIIN
jgi:eukaryotic-like serine/threonine-protein kinase